MDQFQDISITILKNLQMRSEGLGLNLRTVTWGHELAT